MVVVSAPFGSKTLLGTMVQCSRELGRWGTCLSVCSFAHNTRTLACSIPLASLARSAVLICLLFHSLTFSRAHVKVNNLLSQHHGVLNQSELGGVDSKARD